MRSNRTPPKELHKAIPAVHKDLGGLRSSRDNLWEYMGFIWNLYGIYMGNILEIMMFNRDDNGIYMGFIREI